MLNHPLYPIVTQKHGMGCAVACVASLINQDYDSALALFSNQENAWSKGYYCPDIVNALKKAGLNYNYKEIKNQQDPILEKQGIIVFTTPPNMPEGHFFVKREDGWMNPWGNFPIINPAKASLDKTLNADIEWVVYPLAIE